MLDHPAQLIRRDETTAEAEHDLTCGETPCREEPSPLDDGLSDLEVRMDPEGLGGAYDSAKQAPEPWDRL